MELKHYGIVLLIALICGGGFMYYQKTVVDPKLQSDMLESNMRYRQDSIQKESEYDLQLQKDRNFELLEKRRQHRIEMDSIKKHSH